MHSDSEESPASIGHAPHRRNRDRLPGMESAAGAAYGCKTMSKFAMSAAHQKMTVARSDVDTGLLRCCILGSLAPPAREVQLEEYRIGCLARGNHESVRRFLDAPQGVLANP